MSDDLERQLDDLYRSLDGSARRVEARWKSTPAPSHAAIRDSDLVGVDFQRASTRRAEPSSFR